MDALPSTYLRVRLWNTPRLTFLKEDIRSLQPQTYFVQYKDIKTADSHTLYTPTISSGVPAFREINMNT